MDDERIATLAHELRTPLAVILGASRILQRHPAIASNQHLLPTVNRLSVAARQMEYLIANALLLVRLEHEPVETKPLLVGRTVAAAIDELRQNYPAADVRIAPFQDPTIGIEGVPAWTNLILLNLLSVAQDQQSGDRPTVVRWSLEGRKVAIEVWNPRITFAARNRTLDRSYRAGSGLSVARRLAERQRGDLKLRSWPAQYGVILTVVLPVTEV